MIYRGQPYGAPIGEWWTSSRDDALKFAMSRGANRTYVILALDEEDAAWLARFVYAHGVGDHKATWYRFPLDELRQRWRGVTINSGAIAFPPDVALVDGWLRDVCEICGSPEECEDPNRCREARRSRALDS